VDAYSVVAPYEPNFVEFIKVKIPGLDRAWDTNKKVWFVKEKWLDLLQVLATELWGAQSVVIQTRESVEDALRHQREAQHNAIIAALPERERALYEFLLALPNEAVQAAYRKAAMLLHPDRNGGDGEKMSKLNEAWSKLEKGLFKE
jgi:hypothetical protein